MNAFDFSCADSLDAATSRTAEVVLLAGGQGLIPEIKVRNCRPKSLLDIKSVLPRGIRAEGERVIVGAGATHADLASNPILRDVVPALSILAANVGDPSVRHRGTLGGALAENHPSSDWVAAGLALDAVLETDLRQISLDAYLWELRDGKAPKDVILRVVFVRPSRAAYAKFLHPAQRFPLAGSFVAEVDGRFCVAITGLSNRGAFRWNAAEAALGAGDHLPTLSARDDAREDSFASADYRADAATVLTRLAWTRIESGELSPVSIVHGMPLR